MNYVLYIVCIRVNIPLFKDTEVEYQRELRTNSQFIYIFVNIAAVKSVPQDRVKL